MLRDDGAYPEGLRVRRKRDHSVEGVTTDRVTRINGRMWQWVQLSDGVGKNIMVSDLEPSPTTVDCIAELEARRLGGLAGLTRRLTHLKLGGRLADLIYSLDATNTEFHAYQFKPVVKLLNEASRGLLIADEVGLGKTIEAGLVWTELNARFDFRRLLIVCPKSLQEKWRHELFSKFSIRATIEDAQGLLQLINDPSSQDRGFVAIASYSALRPVGDWEEDRQGQPTSSELARRMRDEAGADPLFDLLVMDEAHHLRNAETAQSRLGRLLVGVSDYRLLLTATPINLRSNDLRVLLAMLDPDLFEQEWIFEQLDAENRPLVMARQVALTPGATLDEIRAAIEEAPRGDLLQTSSRLEAIREQLGRPDLQDGPELRTEIAAKLEAMSLLGSIINRTRRRDVQSVQVKRRAAVRQWTMSDIERSVYDRASATISQLASQSGVNERFLLSMPQRLLASSIPAALRHWRARGFESGLDDSETGDSPPGPLVAALAEIAIGLENQADLEACDSKLSLLLKALRDSWDHSPREKVIVFSSFRRTIDYLHEKLTANGIDAFAMHGSSRTPRTETLAAFEANEGPCVLLTSEIGGEGLDLQFCRILVNYDLPWNPMKVEQRIGRLDRIGQMAPSIEILSLVARDTIEEAVYERLYERLELIERTLGGFEAILGPILKELEHRLMDPSLTSREKAEEIERASQQVENQRRLEDEIEREAAGLIAHGDIILNRIQRAHDRQVWLKGDDIRSYIDEVLRTAYPGSSIEKAPTDDLVFDIQLSWEAQTDFSAWLDRHARRFETALRRATDRKRVRFGRLLDARRERSVELISWTHPIVRFCAEWRRRRQPDAILEIAVAGQVKAEALRAGTATIEPGWIAALVEHWSVYGFATQEHIAISAHYLQPGKSALDDEQAAALLSAVAAPSSRNIEPDEGLARRATALIRERAAPALAARWNDLLAYEEAQFEDARQTRISVFKHQRQAETRRLEEQMARLQYGAGQRILPALRGRLARVQARFDRKIREVEQDVAFNFEQPCRIAACLLEVVP